MRDETFCDAVNITINPKYEHLREFIVGLPGIIETQGVVVQDRRNLIKTIEVDGKTFNVKRFRIPIWINRFAYTFLRAPKARKAYRNAETLLARGFDTPEPVALIEQYENRLLSYSFFVSLQLTGVREIREHYFSKAEGGDRELLEAFARYTAALHEAGVLHKDYSPGNILISGDGADARFSLVDINRMRFGNVGMQEGLANFARLFEYDRAVEVIAEEYIRARAFDVTQCVADGVSMALRCKHAFERRKERKKRLKRLIGKK